MQFDGDFNGRIFVPSNIKTQKQAVIAKFDFRDLLYILIAIGLFSLGFFTTLKILSNLAPTTTIIVDGVESIQKEPINNMIPLMVGGLLALPVIIAGFKKFNGLKFEEYAQVFFSNKIKASNVRINNSDNIYETLEKTKKKKNNVEDEFKNTYLKLNPIAKVVFKLTNKDKQKLIAKIEKENKVGGFNIKDLKNNINTIKNTKIDSIKVFKKKKINKKQLLEEKIIYN